MYTHIDETTSGINTIKAYANEKRFVNEMQNHIDNNLIIFRVGNITSELILVSEPILRKFLSLGYVL